jgi:hypothetical protein
MIYPALFYFRKCVMPKRLLSVLACGYVLMFYSEHVFWSHVRADDTLFGYVATWLLYSMLAFAFLSLVDHFKVRNMWALFLCGAVFGWLAEGVVVQTTYESLPLSISFTGLSWHALLSVWVGWYAVRKAIHTGMGSTLKIAAAIGIFYGIWAIWWWTEPDQPITGPLDFALFAGITTLLVMVAYWLYDKNISAFKVGRTAKLVIIGLLLAYFIFVTIPAAPIAIVVLPALLLIVYVVLRRIPQSDRLPSMLTNKAAPAPLQNYLALLAMPIIAVIIYALAYAQNLECHTNWLVYLVTMPLGFVLLGISLVKVWRSKTSATSS